MVGMGRLARDPEIRYTNDNKAVANFTIAIDRKYKRDGDDDADFFNCTAFGKTAEFVEKYLKKGIKVVITGHLQNDTYEKDGQKKTTTKIMIDSIEFAESKSASQGNNTPAPKTAEEDLYDQLPFA
jgi:single-strand DNA-binding protein